MTTRRNFVGTASGAVFAGALASAIGFHPLLAWAGEKSLAIPGKDGMLVRSARFLDLEMPVEYAADWITPTHHFFVRNHMHEPSTLDPAGWKLSISGEVEKPYAISLTELSKLASHSVTNTLECAGNGRGLQNPKVPGVQWGKGAVGTGTFSGPQLRVLLERAGVKSAGKHVMFRGLDQVPGKVPPFIRSIPLEKAMDADTLVATHMNGAVLLKHHGFPARALVPGWIGAASCKWLTEIKVLDKEFEGNFMSPGYRMPNTAAKPGEAVKPENTHPVTALGVKSLITSPADGAALKGRAIAVHGMAWAGEADIARVEVSTDAGTTWKPARFGHDHAKYAWRQWTYAWQPQKPGAYVVLSRATDTQGRVQPDQPVWNPSGYLYNAIDQVKVHVEA